MKLIDVKYISHASPKAAQSQIERERVSRVKVRVNSLTEHIRIVYEREKMVCISNIKWGMDGYPSICIAFVECG